MVQMRSLKYHTSNGEEHPEGSVYDMAEDQVENLVGQGMAARTESEAAPELKPSQPVEPMTSENFAPKSDT